MSLRLSSATDVVLAGCSGGGMSVSLQIDALRRLLPPTARVAGLSDSGVLIDVPALLRRKDSYKHEVSVASPASILNGRYRFIVHR